VFRTFTEMVMFTSKTRGCSSAQRVKTVAHFVRLRRVAEFRARPHSHAWRRGSPDNLKKEKVQWGCRSSGNLKEGSTVLLHNSNPHERRKLDQGGASVHPVYALPTADASIPAVAIEQQQHHKNNQYCWPVVTSLAMEEARTAFVTSHFFTMHHDRNGEDGVL
jgi:hypothetical protein